MTAEILNAKITQTKICEDHSCLTVYITVEGNGWGCSVGGYCLDHWNNKPGTYHSGDGYGALIEIMKTFEVEAWEDLVGQYCRVVSNGWGDKITTIGHYMKDKWFSWEEYFNAVKREQAVEDDR